VGTIETPAFGKKNIKSKEGRCLPEIRSLKEGKKRTHRSKKKTWGQEGKNTS